MEIKNKKVVIKNFLKNNLLWLVSLILILTLWTYAAWDSRMSTWSVITAADWNNMVVQIKANKAAAFSTWGLKLYWRCTQAWALCLNSNNEWGTVSSNLNTTFCASKTTFNCAKFE